MAHEKNDKKWYTGRVSESYIRRPNTSCLVCATQIYRRPVQIKLGRVFCGADCYGKANRKEKPCVVCGAPILARENKVTCSRKCSNTNRAGIKYKIGSPKDNVKDQRAIKLRLIAVRGTQCERCGYSKLEILHVHHRSRDRKDNRLSNLELICPNCHFEEHYLEKSWLKGKFNGS